MTQYQIKVTPNYYGGTVNAPQAHFLTRGELVDINPNHPDHDDVLFFDDTQEAQSAVDSITSGPYYTQYGEAGRPTYEIVESGDYGPDCIRGSYADEIDRDDVPEDVLAELESANVDYDSRYNDEYDTWSYTSGIHEIDGHDYQFTVNYTVNTIALDQCDGDLGGISWTDQVYCRTEC